MLSVNEEARRLHNLGYRTRRGNDGVNIWRYIITTPDQQAIEVEDDMTSSDPGAYTIKAYGLNAALAQFFLDWSDYDRTSSIINAMANLNSHSMHHR